MLLSNTGNVQLGTWFVHGCVTSLHHFVDINGEIMLSFNISVTCCWINFFSLDTRYGWMCGHGAASISFKMHGVTLKEMHHLLVP